MRILVQRVSEARVVIENKIKSEIGQGLLIFVGLEESDSTSDLQWTAAKLVNLRIFNDSDGVMNLSVKDVGGDILVISQFTLHAKTKKGNRPSYIAAAKPSVAIPLYQHFIEILQNQHHIRVQTGEFGADMKVSLTNDGPVTIWIDSKNKE